MRLDGINALWLAAAAAPVVHAHTLFTNFYVNGVNQGSATCVRMSHDVHTATNPIHGITSDDMACGTC